MSRELLLAEAPARRGFLRSMVVAPAAALATHKLILPGHDSPKERARRAWGEFSDAMRELAAGSHGWRIVGAGDLTPFRHLSGGTYLDLRTIHYEVDSDSRVRGPILERHRKVIL